MVPVSRGWAAAVIIAWAELGLILRLPSAYGSSESVPSLSLESSWVGTSSSMITLAAASHSGPRAGLAGGGPGPAATVTDMVTATARVWT